MTTLITFSGILLVVLGAVGYGYGRSRTTDASWTSLIPAAFGVVFIVLGLLGARSEAMRKHTMHAAVVLALIGFLLPAARVLMRATSIQMSMATISLLGMALICLMIVLAGIRSFTAARRSRITEVRE